jgi:hypothetical protein
VDKAQHEKLINKIKKLEYECKALKELNKSLLSHNAMLLRQLGADRWLLKGDKE